MSAFDLVLAAIAMAAASSAIAALSPLRASRAQLASCVLMVGAMLAGLAGAAASLSGWSGSVQAFHWQAVGGSFVGLDPLSAFFLVPVFLIGGLGPVYGLGYWKRAGHPASARRVETFWGLLVAGMALLVVARHAMAFLLGWEAMALSAFFLVSAEDARAEARRAGLVYIIATHVGTLALFAFFALWHSATGSFGFAPLPADSLGPVALALLFLIALFAFGLKAGLMPLHFWLPGAHAAAPSHVSAILSGVVLKMGVYGLLRFLLLVEAPPASWGVLILALGSASALLGVAFAIGQHDLKRLLAYHSVENVGIIFMGLGLAMIGRAQGDDALLVLGLAGCLLHTWNHALFKPLLFLGAGSVVHATHTRDIDHMGGLAKAMPGTAGAFLVGAVAICGLPPLNGFVSELLVYLGLFGSLSRSGATGAAAIGAPVLAVTGALALACFVKATGAVFLGLPRSRAAAAAKESPIAMRAPAWALALACAVVGLAPGLVAPVLDKVIAPWNPAGSAPLPLVGDLAPVGAIGIVQPLFAVLAAAAVLPALAMARRRARGTRGTWDCGYAAPDARMQYTASSFAAWIVKLTGWALRPREERRPVTGEFPGPSGLETRVDDRVLEGALRPSLRALERLSARLRRFQQGLAQDYILYIIIMLIILLATEIPVGELAARLFARHRW